MGREIVVLGAGFAGLNTCLELAAKGYEPKLIDRRSFHLFRPDIEKLVSGKIDEGELKVDLDSFLSGVPVEFCQETVLGIDPEQKIVETDKDSHSYDSLVITLGGESADHGMDISDAVKAWSLEGMKQLGEEVGDIDEAIVVGSGYTGVETAGELRESGVDVTVVDRSTSPMPNSCDAASMFALDYFNKHDIKFMGGKDVTEVKEGQIRTEDGSFLDADVVVWSGGVKAPGVVTSSFDCGPEGLPVNSGLSSKEYPEVLAGGDCADHGFWKSAQNALKQSQTLSENVVKQESESLESFREVERPRVITLGRSAIFEWKSFALKRWYFRYLRYFIRKKYFFRLRFKKLKARLATFL
ncbi:MAG: NAD(P)/FAD-dependent oxidoreductase [Candidatus Nanohaloarchaea archaeon]